LTADFTESAYRELLASAKRSYSFEPFGTESEQPHVLWRHDVDVSVHRAARLAQLEAEDGVRTTYFFWFHSPFYNLLERPVVEAARKALAAGHWLGLHFDSSFPGRGDVSERVAAEAAQLADLLEQLVTAVSFHNPTLVDADPASGGDVVAGLANVYGPTLRDRYRYVSDSNGYWRFDRLLDVLAEAPPRLHVLTHPEWWQAEPLSPRDRIARSVEGRARATLRDYDALLEANGRANLR
jgi:hypothetical protein